MVHEGLFILKNPRDKRESEMGDRGKNRGGACRTGAERKQPLATMEVVSEKKMG